jgi:hypothetical protein
MVAIERNWMFLVNTTEWDLFCFGSFHRRNLCAVCVRAFHRALASNASLPSHV